MKVGVLGSGEVAKTLASGFLKHGHQVKIGSRTPDKLADWATQNPTGSTSTFAEAAAFGDLIVSQLFDSQHSKGIFSPKTGLLIRPFVDMGQPGIGVELTTQNAPV